MRTTTRRRARALGCLVVAGLALGACSSGGGGGPTLGGSDIGLRLTEATLTRFDDCDSFAAEVKEVAADQIGAYGFDGGYSGERFSQVGSAVAEDMASAPSTTVSSRSSETAPLAATGGDSEWSGTNVQEVGVDEPDIVKVRGDMVVTLIDGVLRVVRIVDGQPQVQGELTLDAYSGEQLLADGDTALLIGSSGMYYGPMEDVAIDSSFSSYAGGVTIRTIDLSDPTNPTETGTLALEGGLVDARLVDGVARIVTSSGMPDLPLVQPAGNGPRAEEAARALNEQAVADSAAADWIPEYHVLDMSGEEIDSGPMVECASVHTPANPDGVGMLNVSSFDLRADGLAPSGGVSVIGSGHTVYASTENLYVATTNWNPENGVTESTDIHKFASPERTTVEYRGSGRVDGNLLNQFSMSEHNGDLQVATTRTTVAAIPTDDIPTDDVPTDLPLVDTGGDAAVSSSGESQSSPGSEVPSTDTTIPDGSVPTTSTTAPDDPVTTTTVVEPVPEPEPTPPSTIPNPPPLPGTDSVVSVLREQDGALDIIGSVGGLGRGEQIQAVRFMGDTGYVVTFRQTDPLYTIDLRDPTAPAVVGELKIPGFSRYLHPIDDGHLVGIGRDATMTGQDIGLQLSLYDVSDPANPIEVQKVSMPNASSDAEYDHHAFLWWEPTSMAMLPVQEFGGAGVFTGAIGYRVSPDGIGELGRISHPEALGDPLVQPCLPDGACPEPVQLRFGGTPIIRSVVVDGMVVTVSSMGVMTSDLATLGEIGFASFT